MRKALSVLVLVAMLLLSGNAIAQEQEKEKVTRFGIGGHLGWPVGPGPSLKLWLSPTIGIQGMGSRWSSGDFSLTMLSGRFLLKLTKREGRVFPYLGVGAGTWIATGKRLEWDPYSGFTENDVTESIATFEALLGLQHKYAENFYGDYEIGYFVVDVDAFDEIDVQVSVMELAFALHYFF